MVVVCMVRSKAFDEMVLVEDKRKVGEGGAIGVWHPSRGLGLMVVGMVLGMGLVSWTSSTDHR